MAMFAALALGAPLGTAFYSAGGFAAVAIAATLMPLLTVLLVFRLSPVASQREARAPLKTVAAAVWLPGFGSALSSLATQRGWNPVRLVFSAFAISLVTAGLLLGHVPDQLGRARVALACVLIEAGGLALIWPHPVGLWPQLGPRSPASATRWSIPASGLKQCAACRRRAAASPWALTLSFWMWRSVSAVRPWTDSRPVWPRYGVPHQCADGAGNRGGRDSSPLHSMLRKDRTIPHVIVKVWPGKSEKQKAKLSEEITRAVMSVLNYGEESVSVAMEEVEPDQWMDKVHKPDILGKPKQIYKKPGYTSV
jgi:phenylpyruvate tautomerase PptA (4-oxalocrotonate tautomerase family)